MGSYYVIIMSNTSKKSLAKWAKANVSADRSNISNLDKTSKHLTLMGTKNTKEMMVQQVLIMNIKILVRLMQRVVNDMTVMLQKRCHQNIKRLQKISKFLDFIRDKDERMSICACDMVSHQKKTFKI